MATGDPVLTVAQTQAAEQVLFDAGLPPFDLMQRAGEGAAQWVWRIAAGRAVTVLCGPGNNGGDGFVIAEWLRERGLEVCVVAPLESTTDSARMARAAYGGEFDEQCSAPILVDCLFGTGQSRPLEVDLLELYRKLRAGHDSTIAIDLPSGVASDSGALLNDIPPCDVTVALGAWKWAHWTMPAASRMGRRVCVDIALDPVWDAAHLISRPELHSPAPDGHKYSRGLMAVVAGAMPGAAALCATAAQHGGAGYVKLLSAKSPTNLPHSLVIDTDDLSGNLDDDRIGAIAIGSGLGRDATAHDRLRAVFERKCALVLDADALHLIDPARWKPRENAVMTPHGGELARLAEAFGIAVSLPKRDKAHLLAQATGAVIVAKGPDTIIARADGPPAISPTAPSWLATAGTGDVLAGLVASRLATGANAFDAACEAVWLHGDAARRCGATFIADDLVAQLPAAYAACL